jgi:hypothetical protein
MRELESRKLETRGPTRARERENFTTMRGNRGGRILL